MSASAVAFNPELGVSDEALEAFREEVAVWFRANRPPEPEFLLPESFMEVGSEEQFVYLRDWPEP